MSDLMLEIIQWLILILASAMTIYLLILIFHVIYVILTDPKKKELKEYEINYSIYEYASKCHIRAKNKKQAIKDFYKWSVHIRDVKEVE